jgi:hypothetical protein
MWESLYTVRVSGVCAVGWVGVWWNEVASGGEEGGSAGSAVAELGGSRWGFLYTAYGGSHLRIQYIGILTYSIWEFDTMDVDPCPVYGNSSRL